MIRKLSIVVGLAVLFAACGPNGGTSDAGSGGGTGGGDAGAQVCTPGETESCYEGSAATLNVGACHAGSRTCLADGTGFGACVGQVLPTTESCSTVADDDCDGTANQPAAGCVCAPGESASCYDGLTGTQDIGLCHAGTKLCAADGKGYGACTGQVLPATETCNTSGDDDCDGQTNEDGAGCACAPGTQASCYSGAPATLNIGPCKSGTQTCNAQGTGFGGCVGEVVPQAESCSTSIDDNCNGQANEGCICAPGSTTSCYSGPAGTSGVGVCKAGTKTCNSAGTAYGACVGEVVPSVESCFNSSDEDCNGALDNGCPATPPTYTADVQPIYQAKCAPCHNGQGSGGVNFASSYADTQAASVVCGGMTVGQCTLNRIQEGSMPQGGTCSGNPTLDSGKPQCVTAAQQTTIQRWLNAGQPQ